MDEMNLLLIIGDLEVQNRKHIFINEQLRAEIVELHSKLKNYEKEEEGHQ